MVGGCGTDDSKPPIVLPLLLLPLLLALAILDFTGATASEVKRARLGSETKTLVSLTASFSSLVAEVEIFGFKLEESKKSLLK